MVTSTEIRTMDLTNYLTDDIIIEFKRRMNEAGHPERANVAYAEMIAKPLTKAYHSKLCLHKCIERIGSSMKRKDWPAGNLPQRTVWASKNMEKAAKLAQAARSMKLDTSIYRGKRGLYIVGVLCTPEQANQVEASID